MQDANIKATDVSAFCMPCTLPRVVASLAKKAGMRDDAVQDNMNATCGETGAAHPLLMLARALESAKTGDLILVAGFGQGSDVLAFRATERIANFKPKLGVKGHLARRREEKNYQQFLSFNELVTMERGMRSEVDKATALSALYRKRDMLTGFIGGRCSVCGTVQFPKSNICVNPNCNAAHTQEDQPFADLNGKIMSYTADELTYTPDPPACYGMIQFEVGGRIMMDFTDIEPRDLEVGRDMDMVFRVKDRDPQRGFRALFLESRARGDSPNRRLTWQAASATKSPFSAWAAPNSASAGTARPTTSWSKRSRKRSRMPGSRRTRSRRRGSQPRSRSSMSANPACRSRWRCACR